MTYKDFGIQVGKMEERPNGFYQPFSFLGVNQSVFLSREDAERLGVDESKNKIASDVISRSGEILVRKCRDSGNQEAQSLRAKWLCIIDQRKDNLSK